MNRIRMCLAAALLVTGAEAGRASAVSFSYVTPYSLASDYDAAIAGFTSTSFDFSGVETGPLPSSVSAGGVTISTAGTLTGLDANSVRFVAASSVPSMTLTMPAPGVYAFSGLFADTVSARPFGFTIHTSLGDQFESFIPIQSTAGGGTFRGWVVIDPANRITSIDFSTSPLNPAFGGGSFVSVSPVPEPSHVAAAAAVGLAALGLFRR
jgi:hypothetical protein